MVEMDVRQDKYVVGDMVEFTDPDEYGFHRVKWRHEREHGPGPYCVQEIETVQGWELTNPRINPRHTQRIWICNTLYTGYWFKPIVRS